MNSRWPTALLVLTLVPAAVLARVDPMRPPDAVDLIVPGERPAAWTLGGILNVGAQPRAQINSSWAREGDIVDGAAVLSIGKTSVDLKQPNGKTLTLSLPRAAVKQPVKSTSTGSPDE